VRARRIPGPAAVGSLSAGQNTEPLGPTRRRRLRPKPTGLSDEHGTAVVYGRGV